tara:strand:- start:23406 stop:23636 length:231 start_codon:yes stop_codon:yes gene_type:complete
MTTTNMTLNTLERRAQDAGFSTSLHANALYVGASNPEGGIEWETVRYFTIPGSGGRSRLAFLDAENVPSNMLALLD